MSIPSKLTASCSFHPSLSSNTRGTTFCLNGLFINDEKLLKQKQESSPSGAKWYEEVLTVHIVASEIELLLPSFVFASSLMWWLLLPDWVWFFFFYVCLWCILAKFSLEIWQPLNKVKLWESAVHWPQQHSSSRNTAHSVQVRHQNTSEFTNDRSSKVLTLSSG